MKIEILLYATLRKYGPPHGGPLTLELKEGDRLGRVLEILGMPPAVEKVMLINGRPANLDTILNEGDKVVLFPPVAGG
jgi:molybdopterin synthase sulfur carrier subunit